MRRRVVPSLFASLLLVSSLAAAKEPPPPPPPPAAPAEVSIPVGWKVGDRLQLEVTKSRSEAVDGKLKLGQSTTPVALEVLRKSDSGWVVGWTWGKPRIPAGTTQPEGDVVERLSGLITGFRLELLVDADGNVTGMANAEAARALLDKTFEAVLAAVPAEQRAQVRDLMKQIIQGPVLDQLILKEPQLYFYCSSLSMKVGEGREWDDQLANPFGGDPLPARSRLELRSVTPDKATLRWTQKVTMSREVVVGIIERLMKAATNRPLTDDDKREAARTRVNLDSEATYVLDRRLGWPLSVEHTRNIAIGDRARSDTTIIRAVAPPPPEGRSTDAKAPDGGTSPGR